MRNDKYWANRMRILEEALLDTGYEYVKNLERQYDLAIRSLEKEIEAWYQRFAKNNSITLLEARRLLTTKELKEFQWTVEEYIKYGQENEVSQAWLKQLENASAKVHISRLDSLKLQLQQQAEALHGAQSEALDKALGELYETGYYRTAYEIQKGIGVGWSLHGLTGDEIRKVLSRPWTLDAQTFSDRIWTNKEALVNTVNTQLTQMIMRGAAPDKTIQAISDRFKVSKSQAGRLVMTESAAFANEARRDCFRDLDVERYVIVETLDGETCSLCGQLDGKVYKMSEYQVGVTAPPFHPWCRGTTAPYFEDLDGLGERAARDNEGKAYDVPRGMTYEEWKKAFADGEGTMQVFQQMGKYREKDGTFRLDKAQEDYRSFLKSAPEKNRIYLEQAMDSVEYRKKALPDAPFGYLEKTDTIYYDPSKNAFNDMDFAVVNTHELSHRIDAQFVRSWEDDEFRKAIANAKDIFAEAPQKYLQYCNENDDEGFLSDIFSAVCEDSYRFDIYHDRSYWKKTGNKEKEIFANLFSMETFGDKEKLDFLEKDFPGIMEAYHNFTLDI